MNVMTASETRILLVDDNELNLFLLMDMLQELDVLPIIAESGKEALEFAQRHDFALILLDLEMPDMDGYSVLNKLAGNPVTSEIPVIFMNPNLGDVEWHSHNKQLSPVDSIYKPINKKILIDKVSGYLKVHKRFNSLSNYYSDKIKTENPVPEGVLALNQLGNIIYANPTAVALLRTTLPKLMGLYIETLMERSHNEVISNWQSSVLYHACKDNKTTKVEHTIFWCADGHKLVVTFVAYPLHGDDIPINNVDTMIVFQEIEDQQYSDEKLSGLIKFDPLTRLVNNESFEEIIQVAIESSSSGESLAVMMWGLDHFDYLNTSLGREFGDQVLKAVAQRFGQSISMSSTLSRPGGDEFALLMPALSNTRAAIANAHALLTVFKKPFLVSGHEIFVSASAGIATYPEAGNSVTELLVNARKALKGAKLEGAGSVKMFNDPVATDNVASIELEQELQQVLKRNELFLAYHPVISLESETVSGVEAELYWRHPQRGILPASEFLPVAEEAGLMPAIGEWTIREACLQRSRWQAVKKHSQLALRLKVSQFMLLDLGFHDLLIQILAETGMQATCLELEVIEANLSKENLTGFVNTFKQLNELGVKIILDDIGSNYLHMASIEGVVFHGVKLSPHFLNSFTEASGSDAVLQTVVDTVHEFGAEMIASDTTNAEQMALLRRVGFDKAQGSYFYQEIAAEEMQDFIFKEN